MHYHARLDYGGNSHYFHNNSETTIVEKIVVPFVNGQVITLKVRGGSLFNMKNATFLKIFKTKNRLKATEEKSIIEIIKDPAFEANDCTGEIIGKIQSQGTSKSLTSLIQKALQPSKNQIFIVMKFGDEVMDSAYAGAYKLVAKEFGLDCLRIDEVQNSGKISDQILEALAESKYVICDLTGARPNCYYETGFAHALGKETILLAKKDEQVHFDLQGHRFIQWTTEEDLRKKLRERLASLGAEKSRDE